MKRLNNYEIRPGRHLVVTKSVDNRRLWVNGIPKNRSSIEIRAEMERLTGGVRDIILYPSQADKVDIACRNIFLTLKYFFRPSHAATCL